MTSVREHILEAIGHIDVEAFSNESMPIRAAKWHIEKALEETDILINARELAQVWFEWNNLRQAIIMTVNGSETQHAYHKAYELLTERKEKLIEEIMK